MTEQPIKVKKTAADYEGKPKPWFLKPKRTAEQIAVEGRSPHRGQHKQHKTLALSRAMATKSKKEAIIFQASQGKNDAEILDYLKLGRDDIRHYKENDKTFRAAYAEAVEAAVMSARGELAGSLPVAVRVEQDTVTGGNRSELAYKAAHGQLTGLGVYQQGPVVAVDNSRTQYNVIVQTPDAEAKLKRILDGERTGGGGNG